MDTYVIHTAKNNHSRKSGFTLIELLLYMSIFIILVGGMLYASFYIQSVLQYNAIEYKTKEGIYRDLELLQEYAHIASRVEVSTSSIMFYVQDGQVTHVIKEDGSIHMIYAYSHKPEKDLTMLPHTRFSRFSFIPETLHDTLFTKALIHVDIKYFDAKNRLKTLQEYLLAP